MGAVMKEYLKVLVYLIIAFAILDTILFLLGQKDISTYFIADAIVFLIVTLFSMNLNSSTTSTLNTLSAIIVVACLTIVTLKIYHILI
jgi:uncharacterized membrane protein YcaP (DUF421 family)